MFPVLFALFLNDFEEIVQINDIDRLKSISDEIGTQFNYYLKLFVILYTDDTVLMSESQEDVQKQSLVLVSSSRPFVYGEMLLELDC